MRGIASRICIKTNLFHPCSSVTDLRDKVIKIGESNLQKWYWILSVHLVGGGGIKAFFKATKEKKIQRLIKCNYKGRGWLKKNKVKENVETSAQVIRNAGRNVNEEATWHNNSKQRVGGDKTPTISKNEDILLLLLNMPFIADSSHQTYRALEKERRRLLSTSVNAEKKLVPISSATEPLRASENNS